MKLLKLLLLCVTLFFIVTLTIAYGLPIAAMFWGAANVAGAIMVIGDYVKTAQPGK